MPARFQCKQCGKCCCEFGITFDERDAAREPRLLRVAVTIDRVNNPKTRKYMKEKNYPYVLDKPRRGGPCVFLAANKECVIHATRPQICRDYQCLR